MSMACERPQGKGVRHITCACGQEREVKNPIFLWTS